MSWAFESRSFGPTAPPSISRWIVTNLGILVGILMVFFFLMAFVPIEGISSENTLASRLEAGLGSFIVWTLCMTPIAVVSLLILWKAGRRMDPGSQREMAFLLSLITGLVVIVVLLINAGTFPVVVALLDLVAPPVLFALFLRLPLEETPRQRRRLRAFPAAACSSTESTWS